MKIYHTTLILWLVAILRGILGDEETLLEEPGSDLWYWSTFKRNAEGAGWSPPSTASPTYKVCDISNRNNEPKNWLVTDYINIKNATRLDIVVFYSLRDCPSADEVPFCRTNFTLYSYHTDHKSNFVADPTRVNFHKETVISPEALPGPGKLTTDTFYGSIVTRAKGIYLALLDQGACFAIKKFVVRYRFCSETVVAPFVRFPRTVAPANDLNLIKQEEECGDPNSRNVNNSKSIGVCLSNGEWNITANSVCLCDYAYELTNGSSDSFACRECQKGFYKDSVGNEKCKPCPGNSVSNTDRIGCVCNEGYYRPSNVVHCEEPPKISLSSVQGSYREGAFVNVNCTASGIPEPAVTWIRDGTVISSGKGAALLKFNSLKRTDGGWYLCVANNTADTITNHTVLLVYYPPIIENVTTSSSKSSIGQTVTLKCLSDGVPTPILTWYKPNGMEIRRIRARENKAQVTLREDQDFGDYKCIAANGLSPSDDRIVKITQIKKPGAPSIVSSENGIQASSLTVRWTAPVDDGGSPITGYTVIILKGDTEINSVNISDPVKTSYTFGGLERATNYAVQLFARNAIFEGDPVVTTVKTRFEGPPAPVEIYGRPSETTDGEITLKWKEPEDNGREITQYTVYQRLVTDGKVGEWVVIRKITKVPVGELTLKLERGKVYEFTITATNELGESLVEETKVKRVKVVDLQNHNQRAHEECKCSCHDVIYISIIGVLVFVILVLFIYIIWLHKKGSGGKHGVYEDEGDNENDMELKDLELSCPNSGDFAQYPAEYMDINETSLDDTLTQAAGQVAHYAPLHPSTRSWEVSRDHVTIEKIIGKGAFGQVAKGTATDLRGRPGRTTVAIKMLKDDTSESDTRDLVNELETMKQLKPHPNVIKLLGCVTETERLLVLIEYVPFGDLLGYLRKSRGLNDTYFKDPDIKPGTNLTSQQLIKFAWQIADGMSYLSSKSIIHRDLAARNVLIGENETCKVTDFGMAWEVQQENVYEKTTKGRFPVKWTAYEALLYGTYTTKSDVWSYGVLLYEIFTIGGSPYPRLDGKKVAKLLQQDYRMPKPQHVDDELYQIMMRCWQNDPDVRPAFTELRNQLKDMEAKHKRLINMKMYDKQLYANVEDLNV